MELKFTFRLKSQRGGGVRLAWKESSCFLPAPCEVLFVHCFWLLIYTRQHPCGQSCLHFADGDTESRRGHPVCRRAHRPDSAWGIQSFFYCVFTANFHFPGPVSVLVRTVTLPLSPLRHCPGLVLASYFIPLSFDCEHFQTQKNAKNFKANIGVPTTQHLQ